MAICGLTSSNPNMDVRKFLTVTGGIIGDALALLQARFTLNFTKSLIIILLKNRNPNFSVLLKLGILLLLVVSYLLLSLFSLGGSLILVFNSWIGNALLRRARV